MVGETEREKGSSMDYYISSTFDLDFVNPDHDQLFPPCFSSMSNHHDELLLQSPPDHHSIAHTTDLITPDKPQSGHRLHRRASSVAFGATEGNPNESKKIKKVMHRDIERQRRQEMASLYGSLRSLLPLEYLKGKRSISDHIHEAVSYIKHMEEKIQELGERRDKLKKLVHPSSSSPAGAISDKEQSLEGSERDGLRVELCCVGVDISIDTAATRGASLPRVLHVLNQEGLNVVNCVSTRVNDRVLHSIKSEVTDGRTINTSELKEKIKSSTNWYPK